MTTGDGTQVGVVESVPAADAARPPVRLSLLGPDLLTVRGERVRAGGRGQRAVLIRLALAEGRLVTTDRLVDDLWGDDATDTIVSTLHGYVSRLRGLLGDPSRLRRSGPGYVLELDVDEVDARQFEALVDTGREALGVDPAGALGLLDRALSLWQGPPLVDVDDHPWGVAAAVRLEGLRLGALEARFDAQLACGLHEPAAVELQQAVAAHPLRERFVAQLMVALYRCGRQTDALREYERARKRLVDELGLVPSPELARHEAAILAHEEWLLAPATVTTIPAVTTVPAGHAVVTPPPRPPAPPRQRSSRPRPDGPTPARLPNVLTRLARRPFVGRVEELRTLGAAWERATAGERSLVVVEGEAGVGKTRLAARFATEAHAGGATVLFGRAAADSIIPYAPVVEALGGMLRSLPPEWRAHVVSGRPGLRPLLPFLGEPVEAAHPAGHDAPVDRYVLFETVAELVATSSQNWPILLVVDDLPWADPLTVRLLDHLVRHEAAGRLMILGTARTVPRVEARDHETWLLELVRDGLLERVSLGGLDEREVAELLRATNAAVPPERAASIARTTRGNAFFVTELAEHTAPGSPPDALPRTLRDVLGQRLERLGDGATRLVRAAALAGAVAPVGVLRAAADLDGEDLFDAADELLAAGLLVEEAGGESLAFRHGLVRQVVVDGMAQVRRRAIHARLADAYESVPGETMRRAHHLVEAGDLVDLDRTTTAALAAGRDAIAVYAYEDAITWGELVVGRGDRLAPERRCAALLLLSDAHRALGDRAAARAMAGAAADLARELGDPSWLAAAAEALALTRAGVGFDFGVDDAGLDELLREALARLGDDDVEQRSRLLAASLSSAAASGDLYALRGLSAEAITLADRHGQQALVATAHLAARMSVWRVDMLEQRLESDVAAREAAAASGRPHLQLNALLYLVSDLAEAGRGAEADHWFRHLRTLADEVRQPVYDAFVDFFDARVALLRGQYDDALRLADRGLERGHRSHGVNAEQAWAGVMFLDAWDHGRLHTLVDVVDAAARAAPQLTIWRIARAACLLADGQRDAPRAVLADLVTDDGVRHAKDSLWYAAVTLLTEIARAVGDRERAAILRREMAPCSGRLTVTGLGRVSLGPLDRSLGVAAMTVGDLDAADDYLERSEAQARALDAAPHVARTLVDRALVRELRGDHAAAAALRADAASIAEALGIVVTPLGAEPPATAS